MGRPHPRGIVEQFDRAPVDQHLVPDAECGLRHRLAHREAPRAERQAAAVEHPGCDRTGGDAHPEREVVVYANTSAAVKARADWVVTSSIALEVAEHLAAEDRKIIWAPDRHLGDYVRRQTGADILMWDGACIVHEEFKARGVADLKQVHPDAAVLVHPESPASVIELADRVGSTTQIIKAATEMPHDTFIVATDQGIFFKLQQAAPDKQFMIAPTAGEGATCRSCANCPWMAMNDLEGLARVFDRGDNEIKIDPALGQAALRPLERMLNFAKDLNTSAPGRA